MSILGNMAGKASKLHRATRIKNPTYRGATNKVKPLVDKAKSMSNTTKSTIALGATSGAIGGIAAGALTSKPKPIEKAAARKRDAKSKLTLKSKAIKDSIKAKAKPTAKPSLMSKVRSVSGKTKLMAGVGAGALGGLAAYKATKTKKE